MDVASLISSFATGTYSVLRTAKSKAVRGRAVQGVQTALVISAAVQPASGNDLKRLPEGRHTNEAVTIFTTTFLQIGGQAEDFEADVVTIDESTWEVQHVETWRDPLGVVRGYKCVAASTDG